MSFNHFQSGLVVSSGYSVGHYSNTALFNPPPQKITLAGEWPKLLRENNSVWVTIDYTQTQLLFLTRPRLNFFFPWQGSGLNSLGRIIMKKQGLSDV